MKVKIDQISKHSDARGTLFEPVDVDAIRLQKNVHVVVSEPDAVHGNHYHLNGTETIVVMGPALIRFKENDNIYDIDVEAGRVTRFIIPPGIAHAIKNMADKPNVFVAFNTVEHDPHTPDRIQDDILE